MGFYDNHILPCVTHYAMRHRDLVPYRRRALAQASGRVLEIGIGSGLNLPYYGSQVQTVIGLEPGARLLEMAQRSAAQLDAPLVPLLGSAESMPLDSQSVDTVVSTWTLCSIPNVALALREARRVLKPGGCFLFVEHGAAPDPDVRKWQDRLTPVWKYLGGGCHLNRHIDALVKDAGFELPRLDTAYAAGAPRFVAWFYEGAAVNGLRA
jgi:ubiquinone/menaquinone biosynthesis C-methylase UbiE